MKKNKTDKKPRDKSINIPEAKNLLDNHWICLAVLLVIWIVFFRELLTGSAYLFDDFIEQYYPGKLMSSVALKNGDFPWWNPYMFAGIPFFADLQIAVLYPFNLILTLFATPEKLSPLPIQISIIFHYLLGSVFTFFLGKKLDMSNGISILFAVIYTYSSYMIIHMIHMPLVEAVMWFPLILLLWFNFINSGNFVYPLAAGLIMGVSILAGYPQVPFLNFFFIAVYTLIIFINKLRSGESKYSIKIALGFISFVAIPFGLTAFQLLPTNEFVSLSNRAGFDYDFAKQGSLHLYDFITLIMPKFFGVWSGNDKITDLRYWSQHQEGPWMFSIANLFMSSLIIVLIIPAARYFILTKKHKYLFWFLSGFVLFSALFSLGGNFFFHKLMYDFVPFFNRFRNPAHILYLLIFSAILISMLGIDGIIKDGLIRKYFNKKYFLSLSAFAIILLIYFFSGGGVPSDIQGTKEISSWVGKQYIIFLVFFSLFTFVIMMYSNQKIKTASLLYLLILLAFIEIHYIWFEQNNGTRNPEQVFSQNSALASKIKEEMKTEHFRVNMRDGRNMLFQRNQGYIDKIEFIEGYGALLLQKFIPVNKPAPSHQDQDLLNVKYRIAVDPASRTMQLKPNPTYLPRAKMYYNIKSFSNEDEVKRYMESDDYDINKTLVIEGDVKQYTELPVLNDSINLPINSVKITKYNMKEIGIDVETSENGYLFLSEIYYPAWKVYLDGNPKEILRANSCLRSVFVPKGTHKIEFRYESDAFHSGFIISVITICLVIPSIVFSYFKGRKKTSKV